MKAGYFHKDDSAITCDLCFRHCRLSQGESGFCRVRRNLDGELVSSWLGKFCAAAIDPIEKKPLYHWHPGSYIYSLGSVGCNMNCPFCQNHKISWPPEPEKVYCREFSGYELVREIKANGLNLLAFTYNEPALQCEFICSINDLMRESNIDIALVTNGIMSELAARDLARVVSAANIDVKAFNPQTYNTLGGSLETVKSNIIAFMKAGVHVELTSLIVPGINDGREEFALMTDWVASVSQDIPLHVTRYFPARNYHMPSTDIELIYEFRDIAKGRLRHVYIGNI